MLRILGELFESLRPAATATDGPAHEHTLQLATAVLLIEVARADGTVDDTERERIMTALRTRFTLSEQELDELFALAQSKSEQSHDLYTFTARINEAFDAPTRIRMFELLWSVAWADGREDAHEAHLLRKLADLLHLRHADAIGAKLRARQQHG